MRRNGVLQSQENAAHRAHVLASIGRRLREQYDATQPPSGRLADLVSKIERSTSGSEVADAPVITRWDEG
jgi:hypothetical protein